MKNIRDLAAELAAPFIVLLVIEIFVRAIH